MRPMLDDLELPQVQEMTTYERRMLAEHKPPGMEGSLLQNMGRKPLRLALWGVAGGEEARGFVENLDGKFRAGRPVPFTADIVSDADLDQVIIEDLKIQELAGKPNRYAYGLVLREYIEPAEPEDTSLVDEAVLGEARGLMDGLIDGLDVGLDFFSGLERFVEPLGNFLTRIRQFRQDTGQ